MQKPIRFVTRGMVAAAILIAARPVSATQTAYYHFDGNVNDSSGNNYTSNVSGTTAYTTGVSGQAFAFDGSTVIGSTTTDNLGIYNGSFTVDAYVNFATPTAGDLSVVGTGGSTTSTGLHLIERGDKPFMGFYSNDTPGNTLLAANTWYNIAWVYDASAQTQTMYVDGNLDAQAGGHSPFLGTGQTVAIGGSCCGGDMNGAIDELRVYNTALTQTQVQQLLVPEPAVAALLGVAALGLLARRRRAV